MEEASSPVEFGFCFLRSKALLKQGVCVLSLEKIGHVVVKSWAGRGIKDGGPVGDCWILLVWTKVATQVEVTGSEDMKD